MSIIAIMAVDQEGAIGYNNRLPWKHNEEDMKWFYQNTKNQIVCMGRKTWESPDMVQPLSRRKNVIFTHDKNFKSENEDKIQFISTDDISSTLKEIQTNNPDKNVFVIGGKEIYWKSLPVIDEIYITMIQGVHEADTFMDLKDYTNDFSCEDCIEFETMDVEIWRRANDNAYKHG